MDRERFRRLTELFQAAIEAPPEDWPSHAERAAAFDPEIGRRLAAMLDAHQASIDLLALPRDPEVSDDALAKFAA